MAKIAIITDSINAGGIARVAQTLNSLFRQGGHECQIYTVYDSETHLNDGNININNRNLTYLRRLYNISRLIDHDTTHIFILTMGRLSISFSFFNIFNIHKTYICEHIAFESYSRYVQILKKISYKFCKSIIVLTKHDENLLSCMGLPVKCIQNPSPFEVAKHCRNINLKKYLVVGHLIPRKGCFRMLEIWKKYKQNGGEGILTFAGDGELLPLLIEFIKNNKLRDVFFLGAIKDISSVYMEHDVLLCSSFSEGLPMTFIEAQSFGIPVISYDIKTGPAEIILNGVNGYVIPDNHSDCFVKKMLGIESENVYKRMSAMSLKYSERYSRQMIYNQWSNLLNEC